MADKNSQRNDSSYGWLALVAVYAAAGWAVVEILSTFREILALPERLDTVLLAIFIGGFPVAVFVYWWRGRHRQTSASANAAIVLVAATLLAVFSIGLLNVFSPPEADLPSVAIMPCEYEGEEAYSYLGNGLAEEVHDRLARLSGLRVAGWRAVQNVQKIETSDTSIAQRLGVRHLAHCKILVGDDTIKVTARIIDPADGPIWTGDFQYAVTDIVQILVELSEVLANELSVRMTKAEVLLVRSLPTTSSEAYRLYLQARSGFDRHHIRVNSWYVPYIDQDAYQKARNRYERALEIDPDFSRAWAALANLHNDYASNFAAKSQTEEILGLALSSADRALELDVCSADAILVKVDHADLGCSEIEKEYLKANQCEPNNPQVWSRLANFYSHAQFCEEPMEDQWGKLGTVVERAMQLDPTNCMIVSRHLGLDSPLAQNLGAVNSGTADDAGESDVNSVGSEDLVKEATDTIRALILMDPDCTDAFQLMADFWRGRGRMDLGLAWNYKLYVSDPENPIYAMKLAERYLELGMLDQVKPWFLKSEKLSREKFGDDDFFGFPLLAYTLFLQGNATPTLEFYDQILKFARGMESPDAYYEVIKGFLVIGDKERAGKVLLEALEVSDTKDLLDLVPRPPSRTLGGKFEAIDIAIAARAEDLSEGADKLLDLAYREKYVGLTAPGLGPAYHFQYMDARQRAQTGKETEALELLEFAVSNHQGYVNRLYPRYYELMVDPAFASLRENGKYATQFQEILDSYEQWLIPMQEKVRAAEENGNWDTLALYPGNGVTTH